MTRPYSTGWWSRFQEVFLSGQRALPSTHAAHTQSLREKSAPRVLQQVEALCSGMVHLGYEKCIWLGYGGPMTTVTTAYYRDYRDFLGILGLFLDDFWTIGKAFSTRHLDPNVRLFTKNPPVIVRWPWPPLSLRSLKHMGPMGPSAKKKRWISLEFAGILPTQLGDSSSTKSVIYLYESPIYIYNIYIYIHFANFLMIHHWIWNFTHFGFFLWLRVAHFETSFESSFKTFQSHSIREIHGWQMLDHHFFLKWHYGNICLGYRIFRHQKSRIAHV